MADNIKIDAAAAKFIEKNLLGGLIWPIGEDGVPDDAALLGHYPDRFEYENTIMSLRMYGIPAFEQTGEEMPFSKVIFGSAIRGGYIYVPKSVRDDALFLLNNPAEQSDTIDN